MYMEKIYREKFSSQYEIFFRGRVYITLSALLILSADYDSDLIQNTIIGLFIIINAFGRHMALSVQNNKRMVCHVHYHACAA